MDKINDRQKLIRSILYWGLPVLAVLLIAFGWVMFSGQHPELMPTPAEVWERLIKTFTKPIAKTSLVGHAWASLRRVLLALFVAWAFGISFGILIGWNKKARAFFGSIFEVIRPIPPIAWIPIIIMWFGIGEFPKILLVFIGTFVPLVINTSTGIEMVDKINIDVGKIFGGNNRQILKDIVIPTALPSIFAGIRTSVSSGWTTVLAAEMLGAKEGLGSLVTKGWQGSDLALVLVSVITIAIIGAILSVILQKLEKVVCPWND
ncbi:MAG TPA: ABC transporter permease [Candidatus Pelethocola excrementipullorum]|nr:ABC transporter permease [Candidatus Pelethocola excrementipullorum]